MPSPTPKSRRAARVAEFNASREGEVVPNPAHAWAHGRFGPTGVTRLSGSKAYARGRVFALGVAGDDPRTAQERKDSPRGHCADETGYDDLKSGEGVIYSYGRHFPMAMRACRRSAVTNAQWDYAYLYNPERRSVTTAGHQSDVRRSIPHGASVIECPPSVWGSLRKGKGAGLRAYLADIIAEAYAQAERKGDRSAHKHLRTIQRAEATWAIARAALGVRGKGPGSPSGTDTNIKRRDRRAWLESKAETDRAKSEAQSARQYGRRSRPSPWSGGTPEERAQKVAEWRAGTRGALGYNMPDMLRLRPAPADASPDATPLVETSRGCTVPLPLVRAAWGRILARVVAHREGKEPAPMPEALGDYSPVRHDIATGEVIVGCHRFSGAEVAAFAAGMGWDAIPTPAPEASPQAQADTIGGSQ